MAVCYGQMFLIFLYSCLLSTQPANYDIPGVSVIVFITLLPLTTDDRPIRMFAFILLEAVIYVIAAYYSKNTRAFLGDFEDAASFSLVAMGLYAVICTRNVRELYQNMRIERIQNSVISSLATVVEERDESTGGHIMRCETYVEKLLERMKEQGSYSQLTKEYRSNIAMAAAMHDIGKIKIPDHILNKPGRLTDEEYNIMKKHSAYGAEIIRKTMGDIEEQEYITVAYNIARYHHERYDGKGYPDGLRGEKIPLEARVMALADVYDALISERVYKKAFSVEKAREIILDGSGTQFDPDLVPLFLECVSDS
jgi:HD-GYP domain-containing protein (c-di-GMP phosphodiesterase class II)